jgi:hypothetical protein
VITKAVDVMADRTAMRYSTKAQVDRDSIYNAAYNAVLDAISARYDIIIPEIGRASCRERVFQPV